MVKLGLESHSGLLLFDAEDGIRLGFGLGVAEDEDEERGKRGKRGEVEGFGSGDSEGSIVVEHLCLTEPK